MKKYPLGIMPEKFWKEARLHDLGETIVRYVQAGCPIKQEWVDEYNKLHKEVSR